MTAYNCWKCPPDETAEGRHAPRVRLILLPSTWVSKNAACQKNQQLPTTEPESNEGSSAKPALLEIAVFPQRTLGLSQQHKLQQCPTADSPRRSCPWPHAPTSAPGPAPASPQLPRRTSPALWEHSIGCYWGRAAEPFIWNSRARASNTTDFVTFSSGQKEPLDHLCQGSASTCGQRAPTNSAAGKESAEAAPPPAEPTFPPRLRPAKRLQAGRPARAALRAQAAAAGSHLVLRPAKVAQQPPEELQQQRHGGRGPRPPQHPERSRPRPPRRRRLGAGHRGSPANRKLAAPRQSQWAAGPAGRGGCREERFERRAAQTCPCS